ncbi:magnesium transporter [Poseidonibacter ostreae]|jgi:magnesium transporter|uniref:Magnesium transporter MgtE n=1 Tax=Poseidonibacter ostreae TaxID=2654171 RepID=A0A6L4WV82_9BACT|nr:magnesium transporter [Poseidonibacter ostreae]KAB7886446.1 magnesium transporter [Poseidonibacter ostreae]KAB7890183.1 magnesium transporter [Poseidonibacter ostreae]KAB7892570.1 magnesium transporter [Poseidonibacter ostreae]MAC83831.1 magnesium transporter [Arcobacter sp.]|tara:strand:- start:5721 stop:7073 length:1353 start_codon:yes stop_codon:yes gene_type:complete
MPQDEIIKEPNKLLEELENLHPSDIANSLKKIEKKSEEDFFTVLKKLPDDILGEVLLELPENLREDAYSELTIKQLTHAVDELESDDQTDIIQELEEHDELKAKEVYDGLEVEDQKEIDWLKTYEEDQAGSYMQTELFSANLKETIKQSLDRLTEGKASHELENIHQVFIVNDDKKLIASILLEDLIIIDFKKTYQEVLNEYEKNRFEPFVVQDKDDIDDVAKKFEKYDLNVVAVVGYQDMLMGRITSDDILDVIEENATEQMYQLAGVNDDFEHEDNLFATAKKRAMWLFLNLGTAILASLVIGIFDETIQAYVALAILMPIVASMGGNAGTQTLAVMVRQLALGDIELEHSKDAVKKEVIVSLFNGFLFAVIMGVIAWLWFDEKLLGLVIGLSMILNLFAAGFFGASIPLLLKKFDIDPAIGSTVLLTTVTDIVGFFSFLMLAKVILL